ncbi:MAG: hypothetical protein Q3963_05445, partial [Coriobacteriaceae bacterium]|nr:hypothetical protein [Coriobacteriaceae bacterium]
MTQPVTTPSLEEALAYTADGSYKRVPIAREILSDTVTPITVMRKLKNVSDHCYLLESAADSAQWGRYSFLGYDPTLEVTCLNGQMKVGALSFEVDHPARYLRQILQEYRTPKVPGMPSFTGGLVGYFSYDYLKYAEPSLVLDAHDSEGFKDVDLMLFDKVIAFDNFKQKIVFVVNADLSEGEAGYRRAVMQLGQMAELVLRGDEAPEQPGHLKSEVRPLFDEERYCAMVRQA